MATPERVIPLENVHNFRDLGGYGAADGRIVRWRMLFRADGLQRLSDNDVEAVRPLELRTVIDLRTSEELDERGRFPVDAIRVLFHHVPVIDATAQFSEGLEGVEDATDFLVGAYRQMLRVGADRLGEAIRLLAMPGSLPAVFHCAAGKDRTGLVAALTLSALGVSEDDIVEDYALTEAAMLRWRAWMQRNQPEAMKAIEEMPAGLSAALPAAMRRILEELRAGHGSIEAFLDSIGVGEQVRWHLRQSLLI